MNTKPQFDSILDEVIAWSSPPVLDSDEFTVEDYISRIEDTTGATLSHGAAHTRLNLLVKKGKLTKRLVSRNSTRFNAYRIASKDSG